MRANLRTISHYIHDLNNFLSDGGTIFDLFNIDERIKNNYEAFINFARISKFSLDSLSQKSLLN